MSLEETNACERSTRGTLCLFTQKDVHAELVTSFTKLDVSVLRAREATVVIELPSGDLLEICRSALQRDRSFMLPASQHFSEPLEDNAVHDTVELRCPIFGNCLRCVCKTVFRSAVALLTHMRTVHRTERCCRSADK